MSLNPRTIRTLVKARHPGMWAANNGLNLIISVSGSATWALRYSNRDGKRRLMKLADYEPIDEAGLASLQAEAAEHRKAIKAGADPLAEKAAKVFDPICKHKSFHTTFKEAALEYIAENKVAWKNPKVPRSPAR